ncbi:MAG: MBL fold metallo-hydrolase [Planctomycetota bacterium]
MRAVATCLILTLGGCVFAGPHYQGPVSDHFDGERFQNQVPTPGSFWSFLRWQATREPPPWPTSLHLEPAPAPPPQVAGADLRVTWINHSTLLLQLDGLNVLTDPIWSERCSPLSWIGPQRVIPPGVRFEDLPRIDAVLISHNHYDHLDLETLRRLQEAHRPRFLVPLGDRPLLEDAGLERVSEHDWWEEVPLGGATRAGFVPAQHFANRGLTDRDRTLWGGWVLEGPAGLVYFAGDTGWGPQFAQVRERYGAPRLALLPIGAYAPRWFMAPMHLDPAQAVEAHRVLGAGTSVGIHFGTFPLADEGRYAPAWELARALHAQGVPPERFWTLEGGEGRAVPPRPAGP